MIWASWQAIQGHRKPRAKNNLNILKEKNAMTNPDFIQTLHEKAKAIAREFLRLEHDLIDILQKLDEHKAFIHLGYESLYSYAIQELKLSEANASTYIAIARKSREVPELKKEIKTGGLSISKARRIVP